MTRKKHDPDPQTRPLTNEEGDVRDLDEVDFSQPWQRAHEIFTPKELAGLKRLRGQRGKQKAPLKQSVSLRLDADIVAHYRSLGRGWQTKLNDLLRNLMEKSS